MTTTLQRKIYSEAIIMFIVIYDQLGPNKKKNLKDCDNRGESPRKKIKWPMFQDTDISPFVYCLIRYLWSGELQYVSPTYL